MEKSPLKHNLEHTDRFSELVKKRTKDLTPVPSNELRGKLGRQDEPDHKDLCNHENTKDRK